MNITNGELARFIWETYHPSNIWIVYAGVAVSAVVLLWIYNRFILEK
nr:hypothetical protein [Sunxiuqinia sp.]